MNSMQGLARLTLDNPRKQELRERIDATLDEIESWRKYNAAYHEDDRKFMRFLIPPGKRVLELGCGRGDMLAALKPSYGVGVDFSPETIAKARVLSSRFDFHSRRRGRAGNPGLDRRSVRLHRDCRHHRPVRRYRRHAAAGASAVRTVDAHHHRLLFPSVGTDP